MSELLDNPYFVTLKTKYAQLYKLVQDKCYLICVPQLVMPASALTLDFVGKHILRPSPYFQGIWQCYNDESKTFEIESNEIKTFEGWDKPMSFEIVAEELFYNNNFSPYKAVLINKPFIGNANMNAIAGKDPYSDMDVLGTSKELKLCIEFLLSYPENELILKKLNNEMKDFKNSYVIIEGFESDVINKVHHLIMKYEENLICANQDYRYMQQDPELAHELSLIIESYITGGLFGLLIIEFRRIFATQNASFQRRCIYHRTKPLRYFDIPEVFEGPHFDHPISVLSQLETNQTPMEMLNVLKVGTDAIYEAIGKNITHNGGNKDKEAITTDELIPVFSYILTRTNLRYIESDVYYMQNFVFTNISNTELAFNLINFQAAISFLKSDHFETPPEDLPLPTQLSRSASMSRTAGANAARQFRKRNPIRRSESVSYGRREVVPSNVENSITPIGQVFTPPPDVIQLNKKTSEPDWLSYLKRKIASKD
eukprot:TRINITY_DN8587_c0_g1_i1.p1 TRINITY_DN8587_c0_g1~~TRINITY_DN8587_c0_g1_i1.p1  ORF type:complete len:484 (+),score=93.59 TRINITY_DN8587_c0_g1_i1:44-1495(+)